MVDCLGCYCFEDYIDNLKDYVENEDVRQYYCVFCGLVNEEVELVIDFEMGMKNYIVNENIGIMMLVVYCRKLFMDVIEFGRRYGRSGNKDDLYECLRLIGIGLYCFEGMFFLLLYFIG